MYFYFPYDGEIGASSPQDALEAAFPRRVGPVTAPRRESPTLDLSKRRRIADDLRGLVDSMTSQLTPSSEQLGRLARGIHETGRHGILGLPVSPPPQTVNPSSPFYYPAPEGVTVGPSKTASRTAGPGLYPAEEGTTGFPDDVLKAQVLTPAQIGYMDIMTPEQIWETQKAMTRTKLPSDAFGQTREERATAKKAVLATPEGQARQMDIERRRGDNALMQMRRHDQEARSAGKDSPTALQAADSVYGADPRLAAQHAAGGDPLASKWMLNRMKMGRLARQEEEKAAMDAYSAAVRGADYNANETPAERLDRIASRPGAGGEKPGATPLPADVAQRRKVLRMARNATTQADVDAIEARGGAGVDYARKLAERKVKTRMQGLERGAVREARRGNLGPMQDLADERGNSNGAPVPGMVRIDPMTMNPQQQDAAARWNLQLLQNKGAVDAEKVRAGGEVDRRLAIDRQKRAELVSTYAGSYFGEVAKEHPNWSLEEKSAEARRMAEGSVPPIAGEVSSPSPTVGPQVPPAEIREPRGMLPRDMPAGGVLMTPERRSDNAPYVVPQHALSVIRDLPGKSNDGNIRDIVLAFPDRTPKGTIIETLRAKGWSDRDINEFQKSSIANAGWVFGVGDARKDALARERLGRRIDWVDAAEQAIPIAGPIAATLGDKFGL